MSLAKTINLLWTSYNMFGFLGLISISLMWAAGRDSCNDLKHLLTTTYVCVCTINIGDATKNSCKECVKEAEKFNKCAHSFTHSQILFISFDRTKIFLTPILFAFVFTHSNGSHYSMPSFVNRKIKLLKNHFIYNIALLNMYIHLGLLLCISLEHTVRSI